jgi:membrane-bound lytic murein transglycosylase A
MASTPAASIQGPRPRLTKAAFADLPGFLDDDLGEAFGVWRRSAAALAERRAPTRPGVAASDALVAAARAALENDTNDGAARAFFTTYFQPYRVAPDGENRAGFVTGYYEPLLRGALLPSARYRAPVLPRPVDLVSFAPGETPPGLDPYLAGARRGVDGALSPYPDRAAIEAAAEQGHSTPILWVEDWVELFLAQVQGSARILLPDGRLVRLAYDGRNGQPYTSIGRLLIDEGEIDPNQMSLAALKKWLRDHGQNTGERGRLLMQRNRSYVFFKPEADFNPDEGPVGGSGIALTPLRSIAIDRRIWPYGAPFWIDASLPWRAATPSPFRRLMIAQDTGSAILGGARADLFFGAGDQAGERAGDIRHQADFVVLLPKGETP